jgi:hypothetical protein
MSKLKGTVSSAAEDKATNRKQLGGMNLIIPNKPIILT